MAVWAVSLMTSGASPPQSDSRVLDLPVFGVWLELVGVTSTQPGPVLYPWREHARLAQKLFRGEPAITELDWNFSAIHSSSPSVVRLVGSGLQMVLPILHPGH